MMHIEHLVPQSSGREGAAKRDCYENTIYICRYCNLSRGNKPIEDPETKGRLLDPTQVAWSEHFVVEAGKITWRPGDADAEYTVRAYDLDGDDKAISNEERERAISEAIKTITDVPDLIEELVTNLEVSTEHIDTIQAVGAVLVKRFQQAVQTLKNWTIKPSDPRDLKDCKCSPPSQSLPNNLLVLCKDVDIEASDPGELSRLLS